jgi:hypothetical protein
MNLAKLALFSTVLVIALVGALSLGGQGRGGRGAAGKKSKDGRIRPVPVKLNVYADNWFKLYINGKLIAVDSIDFVPHNVISVDVIEEYPMTVAVLAKDFADPETGLEWDNSQIGDGGLILKLGGGIVSNSSWKAEKFSWGPLNSDMQHPKVVHNPLPEGWQRPDFDDSSWGNAVEYTVEQVRPRTDYLQYDFEGARFIWTESLELDNTIIFRLRLDKRPD